MFRPSATIAQLSRCLRALGAALALLAVLGAPCLAWGAPDGIRQLMAELEKAQQDFFLPGGADKDDYFPVLKALAEAKPGAGWAEWHSLDFPTLNMVIHLNDLFQGAAELGLLERRDPTTRRLFQEMAGRIKPTREADKAWLAAARRKLGVVADTPVASAVLQRYEAQAENVRPLLERLQATLNAMANQGGPPPKGRPLLAEGSWAYQRLVRALHALEPKAKLLEERYHAAIRHDWPGRLEIARSWATRRSDLLGLVRVVALTKDTPKQVLEYAEFQTREAGWALEDVMHATCWDDYGREPFPPLERQIARSIRLLLEDYHRTITPLNHTINQRVWRLLHQR